MDNYNFGSTHLQKKEDEHEVTVNNWLRSYY